MTKTKFITKMNRILNKAQRYPHQLTEQDKLLLVAFAKLIKEGGENE